MFSLSSFIFSLSGIVVIIIGTEMNMNSNYHSKEIGAIRFHINFLIFLALLLSSLTLWFLQNKFVQIDEDVTSEYIKPNIKYDWLVEILTKSNAPDYARFILFNKTNHQIVIDHAVLRTVYDDMLSESNNMSPNVKFKVNRRNSRLYFDAEDIISVGL